MSVNHLTGPGNYQNLFVAKLPLSVTDADLMAVFGPYGPSSATVMLDPVSGRSKGYAFVLFADEAAGRAAAAALDKTATAANPSFDLTIFPSKHSGREVAAENECLYIRNIPNSWPMARVEAFIAEHGKPVYSAVRSDHLGSPVWVVFVEYDSVESARNTLKAVHGMAVAPRCPPILAKYAESDDVKRNRRDRKTGRDATARPAATNTRKASRRIDVTHQMHHPCHATRYAEEPTGAIVAIPATTDSASAVSMPVIVGAPAPISASPVISFAAPKKQKQSTKAVAATANTLCSAPSPSILSFFNVSASSANCHSTSASNQLTSTSSTTVTVGYPQSYSHHPAVVTASIPQVSSNHADMLMCVAAAHSPLPTPTSRRASSHSGSFHDLSSSSTHHDDHSHNLHCDEEHSGLPLSPVASNNRYRHNPYSCMCPITVLKC